MKKTFTINIGGNIFHIDEDAYEKLNGYIKTLRDHFNHTQGKEEILSDIESRIAELLQERMAESRHVITLDDIEKIIAILGEPTDFEDEPESSSEPPMDSLRGPKRLYRDPENQIIGGVCGGLGAYFRIDPLWFRILFIFFLLAWGTGVIAYLILWIALPKATTTTEKLEMKGEKVTIDNIERSIKEEFEQIRHRLNDLASHAKGNYKKTRINTRGNLVENVTHGFVSVLKVVFRVLVIVLGIALLLTGIFMLISFFAVYFGYEGVFIADHHEIVQMPFRTLFYLFMPSGTSFGFFNIGLILFIGVPLVMLIYNASRMIFRFDRIKYTGLTAFNIWLIGVIIVAIFGFKAMKHFRFEEISEREININQLTGDTLYLNLKEWMPENTMDAEEVLILGNDIELALLNGSKYIGGIDISLKESPDNEYHAILTTKAWGKTLYDAEKNASAVMYNLYSDGTSLGLSSYYILPDSIPWTKHEVELQIFIPEGKEVILDNILQERMSKYRKKIRIRSLQEGYIRKIETRNHTSGINKTEFIRTIFEHKIASKTILI